MYEIISSLITCISPIIVAYFGYIATKQQKQTKEFIDLQTKYNAQNDSIKKQEIDAQKKSISEIQNSIKVLRDQMIKLEQKVDMDRINSRLEDIIDISQVNFEYSQSLSSVICAIGDCVDSAVEPEIANKFKAELNAHQIREREFTNRILRKVAY